MIVASAAWQTAWPVLVMLAGLAIIVFGGMQADLINSEDYKAVHDEFDKTRDEVFRCLVPITIGVGAIIVGFIYFSY